MRIIPKIVPLFICTLVFVPLCWTGSKDPCKSQDPQIRDLCELGINYYTKLVLIFLKQVFCND